MDSVFLGIYMLAISLSGLGAPAQEPNIHRVSRAALCSILYMSETCPAKGAEFADSVFYVYELDFTQELDKSILGHEFVHYLQYKKYGKAKNALEAKQRECYAYKIQSEMLSKVGINYYIPTEYRCE